MGQIVKVTTEERELPEALTETTASGFGPGRYLADQPAIAAVANSETVQFVLTNQKQGIAILRETTKHVMPDVQYRTVVVVTDRRVITLVGTEEGDRRFTLDISEITDVATATERRTGHLTVAQADGPTWKVQTEADGLAAVADYLREQSDAYHADGRVRATTQSIRGLFETTVDTAKSFKNDRVAEVLPALNESPLDRVERTDDPDGTAEASSTDSRDATAGQTRKRSQLDIETAIDKIAQALAKTDWTARSARSESPFDLLAERGDELMGIVVHCPDDGRIGRETLERCDTITGAAGTDTVMLATTGTVRGTDARLATELGVRLRNVETVCNEADPPTIEGVTEMVGNVLTRVGWSVRSEAAGPFDLLADHEDELMGVVVHNPEDGTVESSIEYCDFITGAAGTDTVMLATTGAVQESDEQLADELGVRLVGSDSLGQRHVTKIERGQNF